MLSPAPGREVADGFHGGFGSRSESLHQGGLAVERDHGDLVGNVSDDRPEHGGEGGELIEFARTGSPDFYDDDERERFATSIRLERDPLRNAVIGEDEILRLKREYQVACTVPDKSRHDYDGGLGAEDEGLGGVGRLLPTRQARLDCNYSNSQDQTDVAHRQA